MALIPIRGSRTTLVAVLAAAALAIVRPTSAQEPWKASYFPYVVGGPTDGLMGVFRHQWLKGTTYFVTKKNGEEILNPLSFAGAFSLEGGVGTRGSRFAAATLRGPGLVDGWRFHAEVAARRDGRLGYYPDGDASAGEPEEVVNRVSRSRYLASGEVTRRVVGPIMVSVAGQLVRTEFGPSSDGSLMTPSVADAVSGTDAIGRATLVVDTRDAEFVPGNGVLAEAGVYAGSDATSADNSGYLGSYLQVRGYLSVREGTVLAGRFGIRSLGADAPLSAQYQFPGWERDLTVLGGVESHRGFVKGRYHGRGVILGGFEVRHDLLNAGDFGAITLLGFVDGGRVFRDQRARFTTKDWDVGYGGGVALRILRSSLITFNFAGGPDGFTFGTGTGWSF